MKTSERSPRRAKGWNQAILLALGFWGLSAGLFILRSLIAGDPLGLRHILSIVVGASAGVLVSAGVYQVAFWTRARSAVVRYASVGVSVLVAAAVQTFVDVNGVLWLRRHLSPDLDPIPAKTLLVHVMTTYSEFAWVLGFLGAAYLIIHANRKVSEQELRLADAEASATAARLAALRYQLNPHFLFNTLNAVSSAVITQRNAEAEAMLAKLADFLRVTLAADPEGFIPLEDELATLQSYLEIESERFRDRLGIEFACPDALQSALIPSFILQPLIENAVKHAVSRTSQRVTIRVEAARDGEDLVILVEDDGVASSQPATTAPRGTGVGLRNIRQRLEVLYGARGVLQATARERGFLAMVRLPLEWTASGAKAA